MNQKRDNATAKERVRALRELTGLGAQPMSKMAGLSRYYVTLLERGEQNGGRALGVDAAEKLAVTFGCSIEWLMFGSGKRPTEKEVQRAVARGSKRAA